jgi:hypothetical protein
LAARFQPGQKIVLFDLIFHLNIAFFN